VLFGGGGNGEKPLNHFKKARKSLSRGILRNQKNSAKKEAECPSRNKPCAWGVDASRGGRRGGNQPLPVKGEAMKAVGKEVTGERRKTDAAANPEKKPSKGGWQFSSRWRGKKGKHADYEPENDPKGIFENMPGLGKKGKKGDCVAVKGKKGDFC